MEGSALGATAEAEALEHLTERVRRAYPQLPAATVEAAIGEALAEYADRPIRDFIPILVEREVRDRLDASTAPAPA